MKEKMFAGYPDVVNVDQLREMLGGIGYKAAYGLLHDGSIRFFKIGKAFRIPKTNIIEYLLAVSGKMKNHRKEKTEARKKESLTMASPICIPQKTS